MIPNIFKILNQIDWISDMKKRPMHYIKLQIEGIDKEIKEFKGHLKFLEKEKSNWIGRKNRIETKGVNAIDILFPKHIQKKDTKSREITQNPSDLC